MFIKILTPNHNGKIELTVRDLEALIQEAVDKAVREKCAGCTKHYGITYLNSTPNISLTSTNGTNVIECSSTCCETDEPSNTKNSNSAWSDYQVGK